MVCTFKYDERGIFCLSGGLTGATARYAYNERNLPVIATDYEGNTTAITYGGVGNLLSMSDGEGNTWTFIYDEMNRMLTSTDPLGHVKSFSYILREWNLDETAEDGGTTAYEFDAAGCVLAITDDETHLYRFRYDRNNRFWSCGPVGRRDCLCL